MHQERQDPRRPDFDDVALGFARFVGVREGGAIFPSGPGVTGPVLVFFEKSGMFRGPFFIPSSCAGCQRVFTLPENIAVPPCWASDACQSPPGA